MRCEAVKMTTSNSLETRLRNSITCGRLSRGRRYIITKPYTDHLPSLLLHIDSKVSILKIDHEVNLIVGHVLLIDTAVYQRLIQVQYECDLVITLFGQRTIMPRWPTAFWVIVNVVHNCHARVGEGRISEHDRGAPLKSRVRLISFIRIQIAQVQIVIGILLFI